ncbi:Iron import ATP-binding/permease protein IrtA (Iron-regulated transporter A) [Mycobacterium tuberculosis]|nr:Iron import ATP-binding/permease protein IrtA (Iron-regulated transporter A) [Mycobacterium tuberculosis]
MARGLQGVMLRSFGARDHTATVIETISIAPHFVRVRMVSPTLFQDAEAEPAAWLRFWFPDPNGSNTEFQRAYTISEADPAAGRFAVDVVLHDPAGPASSWARTVKPGATIAVMSLMGSSRFDVPEEQPAGYLLIGDSASIPGMNGIIETVPNDVPIEMYLEQHDDNDTLIPLAKHPRLRVRWVMRRDEKSLAEAIENRDWSDWYAWATPEAAALKCVRVRLRDEFGFPKSEIHAQAYWNAGRAMGTHRATEPAATEPEVGAAPQPESAVPAPARGSWRAQAASRLLAPLKLPLVLSGVLAALVTLAQLAPFVLLVELSRLLVSGAGAHRLFTVGFAAVGLLGTGALLAAALTLWLHVIDARFARALRLRLLSKLSRLPLGWFTSRGSGSIKKLVTDDTLALHYLVTHAVPDAVAAVVAPVGVLVYLFVVDWRVALVLFGPVLVYLTITSSLTIQSGPRIVQAQRWAEKMNGEAGSYLEGQPVIRVFGAASSSFRRRLDEYIGFLVAWQRPLAGKKTLMDLATRPATFLWLIAATGTLLVATHRMDPVNLLPFMFLGTTFGARLLGIAYGLGGLRTGLLAARHLQVTLDETELAVREHPREPLDGEAPATVVFDHVTFGYRPGAGDPGCIAYAAAGHGHRARRPVRLRQVDTGHPAGSIPRCRARCDTRWWTGYSITGRGRAVHASRLCATGSPACAWHRRRKHRAGGTGCPRRTGPGRGPRSANPRPGASAAGRLRYRARSQQWSFGRGATAAHHCPCHPRRHSGPHPRRGHRVCRSGIGIPCATGA